MKFRLLCSTFCVHLLIIVRIWQTIVIPISHNTFCADLLILLSYSMRICFIGFEM
ncbi:hypothetical protein Hanom_Chr13g01215041 [Helianthus anomalus]